MNDSPRRYLVGGLVLGLILALGAYGALRLAGYQFMRHTMEPTPAPEARKGEKTLCNVSPTDSSFIRFEPGKDEKGQALVPVYPAPPPPPGAPLPKDKVQYWASPVDPKFIKDKPGKDPEGFDLQPVYGELGAPTTVAKKERKIKYWVSPMDPGYVSDKPGKAPCGMDLVPVYEEEAGAAKEGTIIVLSSHQMETVERLCDRVVLINRGEKILDGAVSEVKSRYGKNTVVLAFEGDGSFIESLPGVAKVTDFKQYLEVRLEDGHDPQPLLHEAAARLRLRRFEIVEPSLHDIFVEAVTSHGQEAA